VAFSNRFAGGSHGPVGTFCVCCERNATKCVDQRRVIYIYAQLDAPHRTVLGLYHRVNCIVTIYCTNDGHADQRGRGGKKLHQ